jgi:hypothetical protein
MELLSFELFEALFRSTYDNGYVDKHYDERVFDRLSRIKVTSVVDSDGKIVNLPEEIIKESERFFSKALTFIADPDGEYLKNIEVKPGRFGMVRLGDTIISHEGQKLFPRFTVINKVKNDGTTIYEKDQLSIWILTVGDNLKTILAQPDKEPNVKKFADMLMTHYRDGIKKFIKSKDLGARRKANDKYDEVLSLSTQTGLDLEKYNIADWVKNVEVVSADLPIVFESSQNASSQFLTFAKQIDPSYSSNKKEDTSNIRQVLISDAPLEKTKEKTEVTVTPGKSWYMTWNENKKVWGAQPVLEAKIAPGADKGNSLRMQVGLKWLHWLPVPNFNVASAEETGKFTPFNIVINKGEKVMFARQNKDGSWIAKGGIVKSVSAPDSTHVNPYLSFEGEAMSETFSPEEGEVIFKNFVPRLKESFVFRFSSWLNNIN